MRQVLAFAVLAGAAAGAAAASWAQEPSAVFGIPFGASYDELNLPNCPAGDPLPAKVCIDRSRYSSRSSFTILGLPYIGPEYTGTVFLHNDKVVQIIINASHDGWFALRKILVERYGPPTSDRTTRVKTAAGVEFDAQELDWTGERVSIEARERYGRIDKSKITIMDNAHRAMQIERQGQHLKDAAGKF